MSTVFIVLPNDVVGGVYQASLFVSPRLTGTSLAGTAFANWPQTLAGLTFRLTFDVGGPTVAVTPTPQYDATLWTTLFGAATVRPFAFQDNSGRPVWSYSVARTKAFVDSVYATVQASSPTTYPSVDAGAQAPLGVTLQELARVDGQRVTRGREYYNAPRASPTRAAWAAAALAEQQSLIPSGLTGDSLAIYLARRFYDRPASTTTKDAKGRRLAAPRPTQPTFDFHQKLAVLADHPFLLRKLGLVLDVQFSLAAARLPSNGWVRVTALDALGAPLSGAVAPRTNYEVLGTTTFRAFSPAGSTDVQDRFIPLDSAASYFTSQGEPDGDTQKVMGLASSVSLLSSKLSAEAGQPTPAPPQTLPARRSAGLYVARNSRADALKARFTANAAIDASLATAAPMDLGAPDLLRGYRVDVRTSSSAWYSLHRRRVTYGYGQGTPTPIGAEVADEGYLKAASGTSDPAPDGPPDLYLHEVLFGWEGWSLGAPRPGRRLMPVYATPADSIAVPDDTPSPDFPLHAPVRAEPGSLAPLRFGVAYAFRVRAVDLAGNSLPPGAPDPATPHGSGPQTYKRYEPVLPPTVVLRFPVTEGESVEHLVIRSGEGMGAAAYAQHLNAAYPDASFPLKVYQATAERHLAPPKASQSFAEAHGDFDGAFGPGADTRAFFRLGTREEGTFSDKRIPSLTVNDGYLDGNPNQAAIITPPQVPLDQRRPADGASSSSPLTQSRGDALAPGEYVVCGVADAVLPYLPDSAAGGAVLYDAAASAPLLTLNWRGTWPDWAPVRLQLTEGPAVSGGTVLGRLGTVTLPPGTILTLEYSSTPAANRLTHLAYFLDHAVPAAELSQGRHWMLTPRRELVMVHAVPKPLAAPVATLQVSRFPDQTYVSHVGTVACHSGSTNHVDLEASWDEVLDVPSKPLPDDGVSSPALKQTGHAYQVPVAYGQDAAPIRRLHHEFHDTRHRNVRYTPVAHTRYKEYFPAALVADASKVTLAGSTPGPKSDGTFSIPSSSRPAVPRVLYVVPSFRWESGTGTSVRRGGGVRVYLDRPWYTTGEGELLAVLVSSPTAPSPVAQVSRWGRDPLFADGVAAPLSAADFVAPAATAQGLALVDGSGTVDVVAYPVEFNPARRLWYCDLVLDPASAYFPFVSLSLARYQPESLTGLELSAPVRADFAQLTADRTLEFTFDSQAAHLAVSGVVSTHAAEGLLPAIPLPPSVTTQQRQPVPASHPVVAYVQERTPGSVGELGWSPLGGETAFAGSRPLNSNLARWVAAVPLPSPTVPGRARRVVVEEREYYQADPGNDFRLQGTLVGVGLGYRVVYLDTVPVPG